jgi:prevent-host-death family protein
VKEFAAEQLSEKLREFLNAVEAGEASTITSSGKPVAQVTPVPTRRKARLGTMAGQIWAAPDWAKPDPEIESLFYNSALRTE